MEEKMLSHAHQVSDREVVYQSTVPWPEAIDHTLVMYCSDPWYKEATAEFVDNYLELHHCDQLVAPGGSCVVLQSSLTFTTDRQRLLLLNQLHALQKTVAIAHANCAAYKQRYPTLPDEQRRKKQEADLFEFQQYVSAAMSGISVELYFAEAASEHVQFTRIR